MKKPKISWETIKKNKTLDIYEINEVKEDGKEQENK